MQSKETRLTNKEYWIESYGDHKFGKQDKKHDINIFINKYSSQKYKMRNVWN